MPGLTENVVNYAYGISETVYDEYAGLSLCSQKFQVVLLTETFVTAASAFLETFRTVKMCL